MNELLLIIPAFNEEESLPTTIDSLRDLPYDFVVVNDGSTDATAQVAQSLNVPFVSLPFNQGLAGAFMAGMQYAKEHGYSYAMQFDADGQHLPQYIEGMLRRMKEEKPDILIGSRFLEKPMPVSLRSLGSLMIRLMYRLTTGTVVNDPTSGMRMYNRKMIEIYAKHMDLTPEPDTLAYLKRNGARISEHQVSMKERVAGVSYLSSWSAARYMIKMAASILLIQFARPKIAKEVELI